MNIADPTHVKTRNRRERRARERELTDLKAVMSAPEGRRVIWRLLSLAGMYRTSMTGDNWTYFNEGARNLGIVFQADLHEACPDAYLLAMQEANKTQKREDDAELAQTSTPEEGGEYA